MTRTLEEVFAELVAGPDEELEIVVIRRKPKALPKVDRMLPVAKLKETHGVAPDTARKAKDLPKYATGRATTVRESELLAWIETRRAAEKVRSAPEAGELPTPEEYYRQRAGAK